MKCLKHKQSMQAGNPDSEIAQNTYEQYFFTSIRIESTMTMVAPLILQALRNSWPSLALLVAHITAKAEADLKASLQGVC